MITNRFLLLLGLCAAAASTVGCDRETYLVGVNFEIDASGGNPGVGQYTKDEIEDYNLTSTFVPDYVIVPTGIAMAVHITGTYVEVDKNATEADIASGTAVTAPTDEVLTVISSETSILGVKIVDTQDQGDTRARWVVYGAEEGTASLIIEGSETLGTVYVPAHVVFQ